MVTVKQGLYHRDAGYRAPPVRTLRTRAPEPTKLLGARAIGRIRMPVAARFPNPWEGPRSTASGDLVRDYLYVPDALVPWIPFAVAGVRRALRAGPGPAVLMSTSVPYSAHLAALAVARSEGVPWVAELRDPWSLIDDRIRPRSRARKWADAALESRVVAAAERARGHIRADARGDGACLPGAVRAKLGGEKRVRAARGTRAGAARAIRAAGARLRGIGADPRSRWSHCCGDRSGSEGSARARRGCASSARLSPGARRRAALGGLEWLRLDGVADPATAQRAVAGGIRQRAAVRPGEVNRQYVSAKLMDYLGARRPILGADLGDR